MKTQKQTETEIPKRRFALEEKDLSVEADENNQVAEEKENRFLDKIQQDATDKIEHDLIRAFSN